MTSKDQLIPQLDIKPFNDLLLKAKAKRPLPIYDRREITRSFQEELINIPSPYLLNESLTINDVDDFYNRYHEVYSITKQLEVLLRSNEPFLVPERDSSWKSEVISLFKEVLFELRAALTSISQLKDRITMKENIELVKQQIKLAKNQTKTTRTTLCIARISLGVSIIFGAITLLSAIFR